MSYCRWSSDDYQCDVYAYESVNGGYDVHIASIRRIFKKPLPDPVPISDMSAWIERHEIVLKMLDDAERKPIGLSHDGEDHKFNTPEAAADFLRELKAEGYNVPDYAIDELLDEAEQEHITSRLAENGIDIDELEQSNG